MQTQAFMCVPAVLQVRKPTNVVSTICDDRGEEPTYAGEQPGSFSSRACCSSLQIIRTTCVRHQYERLMIIQLKVGSRPMKPATE
jgi:hypothetical protein